MHPMDLRNGGGLKMVCCTETEPTGIVCDQIQQLQKQSCKCFGTPGENWGNARCLTKHLVLYLPAMWVSTRPHPSHLLLQGFYAYNIKWPKGARPCPLLFIAETQPSPRLPAQKCRCKLSVFVSAQDFNCSDSWLGCPENTTINFSMV